jgi:hypothetical protein
MIRRLEFYEKELQDQIRQYNLAYQMGNIRLANGIYDQALQPALLKYKQALFHSRNQVPQNIYVAYDKTGKIRLAAYLENTSKLNF